MSLIVIYVLENCHETFMNIKVSNVLKIKLFSLQAVVLIQAVYTANTLSFKRLFEFSIGGYTQHENTLREYSYKTFLTVFMYRINTDKYLVYSNL